MYYRILAWSVTGGNVVGGEVLESCFSGDWERCFADDWSKQVLRLLSGLF